MAKHPEQKQADICKASGIDAGTLSRFLDGRNALAPENAQKLIDFSKGEITLGGLLEDAARLKQNRKRRKAREQERSA